MWIFWVIVFAGVLITMGILLATKWKDHEACKPECILAQCDEPATETWEGMPVCPHHKATLGRFEAMPWYSGGCKK